MSSNGMSAKELLKRDDRIWYRPIATFVESFDNILNGGIKPGIITEIVGDSGLGKTCLCCQLCLNIQIPMILQGLQSQALFIDTENSFVTERVKEMAEAFVRHCNSVLSGRKAPKLTENGVMSAIHVVKCKNLSQLEQITLSLDKYLGKNRKVKLIVIDSMAFPYYSQEHGFRERGKSMYGIGQVLHYLAEKYGVAVVVTNKFTTRYDQTGNEYFVPFLGESWYHIPNQRINLCWGNDGRSRIASIVKSSSAAPASVNYNVTAVGIRK